MHSSGGDGFQRADGKRRWDEKPKRWAVGPLGLRERGRRKTEMLFMGWQIKWIDKGEIATAKGQLVAKGAKTKEDGTCPSSSQGAENMRRGFETAFQRLLRRAERGW